MEILSNEKLIKRNARIGQITMLAGLGVLLGGMYISFTNPEEYFSLSIIALFVGFILSQIGIYFSNRWGKRPRPDEILDKSLKGLDSKYTLYHYRTPASHLLIGPAGILVIIPKQQGGTISYSNGRYRQKGGNLYLKIFGQEGIGRPEIEIKSEIDSVLKYLQSKFPDSELPQVEGILVFTNPKVVLEINEEQNPPADSVQIDKLKDLIRKKGKSKPLPAEMAQNINNSFA